LELKVDYVDIFFWGWVTQPPTPRHREMIQLLKDAKKFNVWRKRVAELSSFIEPTKPSDAAVVAQQVAEEIQSRGYARFVGTSFHDRKLARPWIESGLSDVVMLRYNPCE